MKTVFLLFEFTEVAPNVLSFESSILKITFSLYVNIHFVLIQIQNHQIINIDHGKLIIHQITNLIERFTIANCSSLTMKTNENSYNAQNINIPLRVNQKINIVQLKTSITFLAKLHFQILITKIIASILLFKHHLF